MVDRVPADRVPVPGPVGGAGRIAASANAVCSDSEHSQPGISPANASITNAVSANLPVTVCT
jgi:hypothetical protein